MRDRRDSDDRFRILFESAGDAILLMRGGRFIDCNAKAEELYGLPHERLVEMGPLDASPPAQPDGRDSREMARELLDRALGGEVVSFEWTHLRPDGSPFEVKVTLNRVEVGGETLLLAHVRDITEQKRLEERLAQAQKMETVGQLAGGIAHDFNNLLAPILGYAELLAKDLEPDDPRQEELAEIHKAAMRARTLTRQLLAFSHKQVLQMKVVDLGAVVTESQKILRRTIREDIDIRILSEPGLDPVCADPHQIEQVLMNLAVNARDAMTGPGVLTIETANVLPDQGLESEHTGAVHGSYVRLAVSDTGVGMDAATRARIFEPFFTTKGKGKGTGLGLATVYGIIKQHGGIVRAKSEPGKGSRFEVYLPVVEAPDEKPDRPPEAVEGARGSGTIVVVEDDENVRRLTCRVLRSEGYEVLGMESARACLDELVDDPRRIDLLVTDVIMPEMNGRQLYEHLCASRPGLPVLYMSGYTDDVVAGHGVPDDGVHLLAKPFTIDDLRGKVRRLLL